MEILTTCNQVNEALEFARVKQKKIAFVPTMGFLHDGHLALVRKAKQVADIVIVSIFVNQAQFNEANDFLEYPRDIDNDAHKLLQEDVDYLFVPDEDEIYPVSGEGSDIKANKDLSSVLCGKFRPGHFDGVCKVLKRLFEIVTPDIAVFGLKDFQQFVIVKKMIGDLNLDIEIVGVETVKQDNLIAMSSRNARLNAEQLNIASKIAEQINNLKNDTKNTSNINSFLQNRSKELEKSYGVTFDYIESRSELDLMPADNDLKCARLFWAYKIGDVRLIDNVKI